MSSEHAFPAAPASVPAARRFVRQTLDGLPEPTMEALTLIVSELATNCVSHAGSGFRLAVDRNQRHVRIEVTDTGAGEAQIRTPAPTDVHGRGLRIVDTLSDEWGVVPSPTGVGKTVWFALNLPAEAVTRQGTAHDETTPPARTVPPQRGQRPSTHDTSTPDHNAPRVSAHRPLQRTFDCQTDRAPNRVGRRRVSLSN